MKIATFNINGINGRLDNLLDWLATAQPDIVCLQELKAPQDAFPQEAIASAGYAASWVGQKSWNGVAILSRIGEPVVTRRSLPGDPADAQARYIEAAVAGILVASIYAPNGNPQPGAKFAYKLAWLERLRKHATALRRHGVPIVLAGDYNVAPTDLDIYPTSSWNDDALIHPESRAAYRRLVGRSWLDALRHLHPRGRVYTFWHYKRMRWQRDAGLRLDHLLLNRELADRLVEAGVDREVRGREGASDHAPVWVRLRKI
ncbi:exodeoxyribonuclease III [Aquibium sp. ELW1220]|jgi:exodeoxyribonuclease-3|uniref:exodeoxyribonuclease III n=1 Tax=Aquibium sp. ELW1220 TaxID=2976766 RepID=UPI0025AF4770|nr:exodeoxyribonuclease III [Aquibium sp. ELW1220]MDN2580094.1 exodeoxyribonuclease III [Aquibium sp. ELW1220]